MYNFVEKRLSSLPLIDDHDCIFWDGRITKAGYGLLAKQTAHRAIYEEVHGRIPAPETIGEALHVRHLCDNPPCINPEHLALGTSQDNSNDARRLRAGEPRYGRAT